MYLFSFEGKMKKIFQIYLHSSKHLNADLGAKINLFLTVIIRQSDHFGSEGFLSALFF